MLAVSANGMPRATVLALGLALAIPAFSAAEDVRFTYLQTLDLTVEGDRPLRPSAVSCDPFNSEIVVTDDRQAVFVVANTDGVQIFRSGVFANLSFPGDGTLDARGGIVFVDQSQSFGTAIRRLDLLGEPEDFLAEALPGDWHPRHLIVTRDGDYLTVDSFRGILAKHSAQDGSLLWQATIENLTGSDALHIGRPAEAPDGRIFIPGGSLNQVLVFSAGGEPLTSFGRYGSSPGRMIFPVGAAFLPDGTLLVLDRMRHKVMAFAPDLGFLGEYGSMGAGPGQFYHPAALAADLTGRCFVAQGFQGRVQVFQVEKS